MTLQLELIGFESRAGAGRHGRDWRWSALGLWSASVLLTGCGFDTQTSGNPALDAPREHRAAPRVGRRPGAPLAGAGGAYGMPPSAAGVSGAGTAGTAGHPSAASGSGAAGEATESGTAGAESTSAGGAGAPLPPPAAGASGGAGAAGPGDSDLAGASGADAGEGAGAGASAQPAAAGEGGAGAASSGELPDAGDADADPGDGSDADDGLLRALIELVGALTTRRDRGAALVELLESLSKARSLDAPLMSRILSTLDDAGACEGRGSACDTACELMRPRCRRCERDASCEAAWEASCDADSARCN
jgi:hypothetical protein